MDGSAELDSKVQCKYGASCYQKNEAHLKRFTHDKKVSPAKPAAEAAEAKLSPSVIQKVKDSEDQQSPGSSSESPPNKKLKTEEPVNNPKLGSGESLATSNNIDKKNGKVIIKKLFLVDMPDEFYSFWDLCVKLNPKKPLEAFKECNLKLVGPFEVLAGDLTEEKHSAPSTLAHWRYYYDPPEFQTVICGDDKKQLHIGYYRDDPNEMPAFVASNCAAQDCIIKDCGPNLFAAVDYFVASHLKSANPFSKIKIQKLQTSLQNKAKEDNIGLYDKSAVFARKKMVVCPTFHKAGLVVPYNKKSTVGYRQMETEDKLKKLLSAIAEAETEERQEKEMEALDSLITYANIANDECDFGGALELGINLFCHGSEVFHPQIQGMLISTYHLLNRSQYAEIIKAHIGSGRKKGTDLSIIV